MRMFRRTRASILLAAVLIACSLTAGVVWLLLYGLGGGKGDSGLALRLAEGVIFVLLPAVSLLILLAGVLTRSLGIEDELARATAAGRIGTWTYHPASGLAYVAASELVLLGYAETRKPGWYPAFDNIHPDDVPRAMATIDHAVAVGARDCRNVYRLRLADGRYVSVEARGVLERDSDGNLVMIHGVHFDISGRIARKAAANSYDLLPSLKEQALNAVREGVILVDMGLKEQPIIYVSDGFLRLTGYDESEVIGRNCRFLQASDDAQPAIGLIRDALGQGRTLSVTLRNYRKNGTMFWNELSLSPIHSDDGKLTHYAGVAHDVTEAVEGLNKMREAAYQDGLTGIRNRLGLERDLEDLVAERGTMMVAVALFNVRGMGSLNESYGMDVGDQMLSSIARRLRSHQSPNRLSARTGGNEFAFAFTAATFAECEGDVAALKALLSEPFNLAGGLITIGVSMGWATTVHSAQVSALIRNAEIALADAWRSAAGTVSRFEPALALATEQRSRLVAGMREAISRDELSFLYQPIVDLETGQIVQVEALMRWHHASYGPQSPAVFIPLAEESGLIDTLGGWGIDRAAQFAAAIAGKTAKPIPISVNVSGAQFTTTPVLKQLEEAIARYGIPPNLLVVELTESVLADETKLIGQLAGIRAAGFKIAIDDFGTGYSSLSYLQNYPIQEIKIDKGFIRKIEFDSYSVKIVRMCVELAREMGCSVVAEGVETAAECQILREVGCDFAQGYFFARPMTEEQLIAVLDKGGLGWSGDKRPPGMVQPAGTPVDSDA
ncbi:PAS domain S-box-containing protein/diguanylate cyclase (GGDEF)-like protein [Amorphus suaedae]